VNALSVIILENIHVICQKPISLFAATLLGLALSSSIFAQTESPEWVEEVT